MPRLLIPILGAIFLLGVSLAAGATEPVGVWSAEPGEAPFVLVAPAKLVRAHPGLKVVLHDDGAGQRLVFSLSPRALVVTLRQAGQAVELARTLTPLPTQTAQVVIKRLPGGYAVAYDAVTVLRGKANLPDGGRWGLLGAPPQALEQLALQPTAPLLFSDDFMRTPDEATPWETRGGQWRVAQLESARYSANAFTLLGSAPGSRPALTTAGYWFWEDLTVEAAVRPSPGVAGFGLGLACHSLDQLYLLRFLSRSAPFGTLQLVRIRGGQESLLSQAPVVAPPEDWHRLAFSGVEGRLEGALNGVPLVSAPAPDLAHGQIALWVAGPRPVAFDDVEAYSGPRAAARPVVLSHEAQTADPGAQAFIGDRYMQQWADERSQWLPDARGVWHSGYYWGDVALSWEVTAQDLSERPQLHLGVPAGADTYSAAGDGTGCHLELALTTAGQLALTLREGSQVRAHQTLPVPEWPTTVTLRRWGTALEALVGGKVAVGVATTVPVAGKVGLTAPYASRQTGRLAILSPQVMDSTFRSAPTDWSIGSGEWGVASRWACSPRWSWFQGRAEHLASIWTRRRFTGDVVVEFFAGLSMDQPWAPFYRHPGNLAVTLAGAEGTPGSGYSLVFAGWGNSAAGIFRQGELVAKVPGLVMPDIVDSLGGTSGYSGAHELHNEWRRIRAERLGPTVRLLVDGRLAASFEDPKPLPGGSVGIWTLNQGITVARARVYYQGAQTVSASATPPARVSPRPGLSLPRWGPARRVSTFEQGLAGWQAAAPGACTVRLARRGGPGDGLCLEAVNPSAGGSFALAAPWQNLNLREHPFLTFDYAVPAEVHMDLFARVAGQRYRVVLSGPPAPVAGSETLSRVAAAAADGAWHTARLDLLGLLEPHFPGPSPLILETLEFAAYAAPEYLRAGIGGNPAGAAWRLDNVYLGGATAKPVSLRTARSITVAAVGCRVTRTLDRQGATHHLTPLHGGLAMVTLSAGAATATDLVAFDQQPPALAPLTPAAGAVWLGPELIVALADVGPAGVDGSTVELRLADRRLGIGHRALRWRPATGTLTLDLRAAGVQPLLGQPVTILVAAADRAGNHAVPLRFTFTPDLKADATPPAAPDLAGLPPALLDCDFETDRGAVQPWGEDAGVALRRSREAVAGYRQGGEWCLETQSIKLGGLCGLSLGVTPFEASRYPVLEFDYRAPRELRVDLVVEVAGSRRVIKFTDNDHTWPVIGYLGARADDRWRRATVDLQGLLARSCGRQAPLVITDLAFASSGWPGNRQGLRWWLDNVRLHARIPVTQRPADLVLRSWDESGLQGYAWTLDQNPDTTPAPALSPPNLGAALAPHAGALAWLHAVAVDSAGNRSEATHLPLKLAAQEDTTPPLICAPSPTPGSRACPATITASVTDRGAGVSPADLRLSINGHAWSVADEALIWDGVTGKIRWSLPAGVSLGADGRPVRCRLSAADLAGNFAPPLEWTFTLDYHQDHEPPAAPMVSYLPARRADSNGFETGTGGWGNFLASQVLRRSTGGATAPGCLELRHIGVRDQASGFVLVRDFGEGWREFPVVRFRYRAVNAPGADLQVFGTTFDGAGDGWTPLGSFPVSGCDWHSAELDLAQTLNQVRPALDIHRIFLSITLPPDGVLLVDDYAMYSPATSQAAFRWAAPASPSGIAGYSWVLDTAAATMPPPKIRDTARQAELTGLKPGRHVFHLRARDGAGNWGPASHVACQLTALPPVAARPR